MNKKTPIPHDCGRVLDINWISATRVNYNCSVCGDLVAWSDIDPEAFDIKVGINIPEIPGAETKPKKVYPKFQDAQYNLFNCEMWK